MSASRAHLAARFSVFLPIAAFVYSAVHEQVFGDMEGAFAQVDYLLFSTLMAVMILAGFVLGIVGLIGGRKLRESRTIALAALGLALSGGAVLLTVVAAAMVVFR